MTTPPTFEIVPGQSIGLVRLGMTVADVAGLGEQKVKEIEPAFDAQGTCRQIRATVPMHPLERPRFSLAGKLLNGLPATEVDALFMSLAADVQHEHALTHAVSIGLFAVSRERLEQYNWLFVVRPGDTQSVARRGLDSEPLVLDIVPGRSIGPVLLGMSRGDYGNVEARAPDIEPQFTDERCSQILAWLPLAIGQPPFFRLEGRILNGLSVEEMHGVLRSLYDGVQADWTGAEVPAVGLSLSKWELGDDFYTALTLSARD